MKINKVLLATLLGCVSCAGSSSNKTEVEDPTVVEADEDEEELELGDFSITKNDLEAGASQRMQLHTQ